MWEASQPAAVCPAWLGTSPQLTSESEGTEILLIHCPDQTLRAVVLSLSRLDIRIIWKAFKNLNFRPHLRPIKLMRTTLKRLKVNIITSSSVLMGRHCSKIHPYFEFPKLLAGFHNLLYTLIHAVVQTLLHILLTDHL